MSVEYIIEFQRREQYDVWGNSKPKAIAKSFDSETTLSEIAEWVKNNTGLWNDDYNILSNPQILGISKDNESKKGGQE